VKVRANQFGSMIQHQMRAGFAAASGPLKASLGASGPMGDFIQSLCRVLFRSAWKSVLLDQWMPRSQRRGEWCGMRNYSQLETAGGC